MVRGEFIEIRSDFGHRRTSGRQGTLWAIVVALLMFALAFALTYPAGIELGHALPGLRDFDEFEYTWLMWWYPVALLDRGQDPAVLPFYYPMQSQQPLVSVTPFGWLAAMPLVLCFGPAAAYTLYWLVNFGLCGTTAYLLGFWLTRSRPAAVLGGLIFAFYPGKMLHALGHFGDLMIYLFPLYALCLLRLLKSPRRRNALFLGLTAALAVLVDFRHIALFYLPFTAIFLACHLLLEPRRATDRAFLKWAALAALVAGAIALPFFGPFVLASLSGQLSHLKEGGLEASSPDLLSLILPPLTHPVLGGVPGLKQVMQRVWSESIYIETCLYPGVVALGLAAIGLWKRRRLSAFWLAVVAVGALLALGPTLKVGGQSTGLPLPYRYLNRLPFYEWVRIPGRLDMMVKLGLAAAAAIGAARLIVRRGRTGQVAITSLLGAAILFEYLTFAPYPTVDLSPSSFLSGLNGDRGDYGVMHLASHEYAQYLQTLHGHDMVEGHIHRWPPGGSEWALQLHGLAIYPPQTERPYWDIVDDSLPYGRDGASLFSAELDLSPADALVEHGIRYVVFDRKGPWTPADRELYGARLRQNFGEPVATDRRLDFFELKGDDVRAQLYPADGWHSLEGDERALWRYTGQSAKMDATGLTPGLYRLYLALRADQAVDLTLTGSADDRLGEFGVKGRVQLVTEPFRVQEHVTLGLQVDRCRVPFDPLRGNFDRRCLGIAVSEARLFPALEEETRWTEGAGLVGYELGRGTGSDDALYIRAYWHAAAQLPRDYTAFVHALDAEGHLVAQQDVLLADRERRPTSRWPEGQCVAALYRLAPGQEIKRIKLGLYDTATAERPTIEGDLSGENAVLIDWD